MKISLLSRYTGILPFLPRKQIETTASLSSASEALPQTMELKHSFGIFHDALLLERRDLRLDAPFFAPVRCADADLPLGGYLDGPLDLVAPEPIYILYVRFFLRISVLGLI